MKRVFLDANVLFSASYRADSRLRRLWGRSDTRLLVSEYVLEETRRNCSDSDQRSRLEQLIRAAQIVDDPPLDSEIDELAVVSTSDRPVLQAAISAKADFLLSGDRRAFGTLYGQTVRTVRVLKPAAYLRLLETESTDQEAAAQHVPPETLADSGVSEPVVPGTALRVRTLVVASEVWKWSTERIAWEYDLTHEQVEEALAFAAENREVIDAALAANSEIERSQNP